ncbi:hypothetical protein Ec53638_A0001 [Escherichia coli 53638]|nr:hypothetical protein Ec53638_A0001 [Escherichia coli 53638]
MFMPLTDERSIRHRVVWESAASISNGRWRKAASSTR